MPLFEDEDVFKIFHLGEGFNLRADEKLVLRNADAGYFTHRLTLGIKRGKE